MMNAQRLKRFWAKVSKSKGCWEWQACVNDAGYGVFGIGDKSIDRVHRISFRLHKGEIPEGLFVLHKCDNRRCVKPAHLFVGTNQDNVDDMMAEGRNSPPPPMGGWNKFEHSPDVIALLGTKPDTEIARIAGVSKYAIQRERKRRGIAAVPSQTKFQKGAPHPRWGTRSEVQCPQQQSNSHKSF